MSRYRAAYPPEFRRQMVELVRAGRSPQDLAEQFEPSAEAIRTWVKQADHDDGRRHDGPRAWNARIWLACAVRCASFVRSGTSWQKRRPGVLSTT